MMYLFSFPLRGLNQDFHSYLKGFINLINVFSCYRTLISFSCFYSGLPLCLTLTPIINLINLIVVRLYLKDVKIYHRQTVWMVMWLWAMWTMWRRLRRVRRLVCRRNCVWCAVIGHPVTITMPLPVKAARASFGAVLQRMLYTVVNLVTLVRWTCTCDGSVRSVDWRSA